MSNHDANVRPPVDDASGGAEEIIQVYVRDTERIEYQKAAERSGLSLAAWIRDRLHEALKREAKEA
jgi:hypothetical protein